MLEIVNLSNHTSDVKTIQNDVKVLKSFLKTHNLDGLEMMFSGPWDADLHPKELIRGSHLRYFPNWLDFWLEDQEALLRELESEAKITEIFGGLKKENLLLAYEKNITTAVNAGASYLVFHVSQARQSEIFSRKFHYESKQIIKETINLVNELLPVIPPHVALLFENLWWPGLTLLDKDLLEALITGVKHPNTGVMLDTGHLMNTDPNLKTETDAIEYVLHTLKNLGKSQAYIQGMHFHHSLSGRFVRKATHFLQKPPADRAKIWRYISRIDQHLPFTLPAAGKIVETVRPKFLVHEFLFPSLEIWSEKVGKQRAALGYTETTIFTKDFANELDAQTNNHFNYSGRITC
ncbi:MAG: sugar phosphate isomerase/epimerase [Sporomusaceae bacterium]|jgi:hypothetical protein|nr:sugar phosphate isomerase/epimerase [Sporomusaceae bacterium]